MGKRSFRLHNSSGGAALAVRVIPRARRDEIVEVMADGTVKIRLAAPPVEGKANRALIEFLSALTGVPQSKIEIVAGRNHRRKLVSFQDLDLGTLDDLIRTAVGKRLGT